MAAVDGLVAARALGRWRTNCVVLGRPSSGRVAVLDPGEGAFEAVPALLAGFGLEAEAIVLSHGHLDHLWSAPALAQLLDVPVHLHPADRWLWDDPGAGFGGRLESIADELGIADWPTAGVDRRDLVDGQRLMLAGLALDVHHTPGHTPGHVTLTTSLPEATVVELDGETIEQTGALLCSGDLLFAGSVGRTDLPGGDATAMTASLASTLDRHADATLVLPGHGPLTTIGRERSRNPHLVGLATPRA